MGLWGLRAFRESSGARIDAEDLTLFPCLLTLAAREFGTHSLVKFSGLQWFPLAAN